MSAQVQSSHGMSPRALLESLSGELSSLCGGEFTVTRADDGKDVGWRFEATDDRTPAGLVVMGLSTEDAQAIASRLGGPAGEDVSTALSGWWSRVLDRIGHEGPGSWTGTVTRAQEPAAAWTTAYRFESAEGLAVTAMVTGDFVHPEAQGRRRPEAADGTPPAAPANLDVILDIDLPLAVRFGSTDMTIEALTRLGPGALIDLGRSPDEPVDVLVNGRMVARGEVVVVGGNYGVRVTEVVSAADRLRSIGI